MKYFSKTEKPSFRPLSNIMVLPTGSPQAPFGPSTHESKELGVVDDAVGVGVGLVQYLGDLLLGERLAQVPHHDGQLAPVDEAVAVLGDAEGYKRTGEIKRGSGKTQGSSGDSGRGSFTFDSSGVQTG